MTHPRNTLSGAGWQSQGLGAISLRYPHTSQGGVLPLLEMISASLFHQAWGQAVGKRPARLLTQGQGCSPRGWVRNRGTLHVGKKTVVHTYLLSFIQRSPIFL